jgi:cell division protein FtsB
MRGITIILVIILLLLQYPLWLGKGSWLTVWDLNRQLDKQQAENQQTKTRNALLDAEVRDLKQGTEAIEERARSELGMIKQGETFFQILGKSATQTMEKQTTTSPASSVPSSLK